jgi:hypothetical protein
VVAVVAVVLVATAGDPVFWLGLASSAVVGRCVMGLFIEQFLAWILEYATAAIVPLLPLPSSDVAQLAQLALNIFRVFLPYLQLFDYFLDLRWWLTAIGFVLVIETALLVVYVWRFILSLIPLA